MPTPNVDVDAVLDALQRHRVQYVVIGGFASELYNVAIPPTQDIDITPAMTPKNLEGLAAALQDLEARLAIPGVPEGLEIPGGITAELLAGLEVITLVTRAGPLDISMIPQGTDGYPDLGRNRREIAYGNRIVPVAALEDVIRSKEAAGREKDLLVLPALRAHLTAMHRRDSRATPGA